MNILTKEVLERFEKFLNASEEALELGKEQEVYDTIEDEALFIKEFRERIEYKENNPYDIFYFVGPKSGKPRFGHYSRSISRRLSAPPKHKQTSKFGKC